MGDTLFDQMTAQLQRQTEKPTANTGLVKVAVQFSTGTFVVNQILVLRINFCANNPPPSPSPKIVSGCKA
ncbi:hypothetical protein [Flavobacterium filum]|uniref:hypothetical protein n=1 Tax=Flavobacterium filum TaxID=370974 RepID=UPI0023F41068|nr:hypothetical protein [Flavobacterium filum]